MKVHLPAAASSLRIPDIKIHLPTATSSLLADSRIGSRGRCSFLEPFFDPLFVSLQPGRVESDILHGLFYCALSTRSRMSREESLDFLGIFFRCKVLCAGGNESINDESSFVSLLYCRPFLLNKLPCQFSTDCCASTTCNCKYCVLISYFFRPGKL